MKSLVFRDKAYPVDEQGFLLNGDDWDENFAAGMAVGLGIPGGLTEQHWKVLRFIRSEFKKDGICPVVYHACKANGLGIKALQQLFPTGYARGACLLAGITQESRMINYFGESRAPSPEGARPGSEPRAYRIDVLGFLVDPSEWDEEYARHRAIELDPKGSMTESHWKVIRYLRDTFANEHRVPTVYECCEANQLDIEGLERLFPSGYHRGAVKIAGLPSIRRAR